MEMEPLDDIGTRIDRLLAVPPYSLPRDEQQAALLGLLKDELDYAGHRNPAVRSYFQHWPVSVRSADKIADLPFLPVGLLKAQPPLSLVEPQEIKRILASSSTTGQMPSRIALDSPTARRMTKAVVAITQDFIGSARRPYLVVDVPSSTEVGSELGARGAAIRGLQPFASEVTYCLKPDEDGNLTLEWDKLRHFAERKGTSPVLVYGFTYILWKYLVKPLLEDNISFGMSGVHILHSGGWKLLQDEAVDKKSFNEGVARVFGCRPDRVIDFYGMVENVGVIYPDCREGNKHVPAFADVLVRDPLTLRPVREGERGIVQVCSVLPTSFPGHLLLTEDIAEIVAYDGCRCGRRGTCFRFVGRVPKAEIRGCGNIERKRQLAA
jgi:phenylacetate-coenzyme A ligase PaaK-like adenylate-forming protein